ncbi:hypothetical protein ACHQM5_030382 [Ranunculus cassubicifolius]
MAPPSPTDLFNSTSRRLSFLDLTDHQMESMDIDLITVPDTPDRLSSQRSIRGLLVDEDIRSPPVASSSGLDIGVRNGVRDRGKLKIEDTNNSRRLFSPPRGRGDVFAQGNSHDVVNLVDSPPVSRTIRPFRRNITSRVTAQPQFAENVSSGDDRAKLDGRASSIAEILADESKIRGKCKDKSSDLISSSKMHSSSLGIEDKNPRKKTLLHGSMSSETDDGLYNTAAIPLDSGKGLNLPSNAKQNGEHVTSRLQLPKKIGQRRLVRNGVISPGNIAKTKTTAESHDKNSEDGKQDLCSRFRPPPSQINIDSPPSGENTMDRVKGKGIMEECSSQNYDNLTLHSLSSSSKNPAAEANITVDSSGDLLKSIGESDGWRSTRNRSNNTSTLYDGATRRSNTNFGVRRPQEVGRSSVPAQVSFNAGSEMDGEKERPCGTSEIAGRQRKRGSTSNNHGECSTSIFDDSEIAFLGSSAQPANIRSTRSRSDRRRSNIPPIIEIDDASPDLRTRNTQNTSHMVNRFPQTTSQIDDRGPQSTSQVVNDESDDRARQLEADEMLARELQEQFYHELPEVGGGEVDANIAWTLQHEEEAQRASSVRRQHVHSRDASMAHLYGHSHRAHQEFINTLRHSVSARATRARARGATSARVGRLRERFRSDVPATRSSAARDIRFHPNMDVEMRMHILETLEAAVGGTGDRMPNSLLQLNRDFNENDYEMLLALDENNHQHVGANPGQINGLPQSTVQSENYDEACAICLDTPTIGDTIRHLPCLHKFHKDCIDPWLRRKTSCPICKSGIT